MVQLAVFETNSFSAERIVGGRGNAEVAQSQVVGAAHGCLALGNKRPMQPGAVQNSAHILAGVAIQADEATAPPDC